MNIEEAKEQLKDIIRLLDFRPKENPNSSLELERVSQDEWKEVLDTVLSELEKKDEQLDIYKTNNEIMQGELDRIGIDTLKLEAGMSTDDVIEEIKKKDKVINEIEDLCIRKSDDEGEEYGGVIIWNFAHKIMEIINKVEREGK